MASDLESQMVSVERLTEYAKMPQEAPHVIQGNSTSVSATTGQPMLRAPSNWPSTGTLKFKHVTMRYRPDTPVVLNRVSFSVKNGEKIGIVGRTGSGKSSLVTALLRLVELESGSIEIDGLDISQVGLNGLRAGMAVIAQDPVLFSGTLRNNLDPFQLFSDSQLWEGLRRAQINSAFGSLDTKVEENGSNFSVGQRQLICIARALLSGSHIIIMDEATAAVDVETDSMIQRSFREDFKSATCLTIAHRLNTIMDSDRVLVMDDGKVAELASPTELLKNENSLFRKLVDRWDESNCGDNDHQ
jgi:ABC-type multidrug transport system fused ATPase/permease subunit